MEFTQETKTEREINLKMYAIDREINRIIGQLENNELSFYESWDLNDSIKHHEFMLRELQKQLDEHRNGLFKIFVIRDFKSEWLDKWNSKPLRKYTVILSGLSTTNRKPFTFTLQHPTADKHSTARCNSRAWSTHAS